MDESKGEKMALLTDLQMSDASYKAALELHSKAFVMDCHSDIQKHVLTEWKQGNRNCLTEYHLPRVRGGGVDAIILSTFTTAITEGNSLRQMLDLIEVVEREAKDQFVIARSADELRKAKQTGVVALVLGMEGAEPLLNDVLLLDVFYRLGIRLVGICWNWRNMLGDPCSRGLGLTPFGFEAVRRMNELGILIDISHLSDEGKKDVLDASVDPVIDSHSNSRTLVDHPRNLGDELARAIADKGGLVGLNFFAQFVDKERATLSKLLDHIDYLSELVGTEHLCLGPDWIDYAPELFAMEEERLEIYNKDRLGQYVQDADTVLKLPNVTVGLVSRGYSEEQIREILGVNMLNLFARVVG